MKNAEWNTLRAKLHHDWMQKYLTFLYARRDALDEMAAGGIEWREDIKEQMLEWNEKKELFRKLLNSCEEALSPCQLFYEPPLKSMSKEDKEWLGEVIHGLYIIRTRIRETVSKLKEIFDEADKAFENLLQNRSEESSLAKFFMDKLTELSKELSKLPHGIQVV